MNKVLFFFKKEVPIDIDDTQVLDVQVDFEFFDEDILLEQVAEFVGANVFGLRPASEGEKVAYQSGYSDAVRDLSK